MAKLTATDWNANHIWEFRNFIKSLAIFNRFAIQDGIVSINKSVCSTIKFSDPTTLINKELEIVRLLQVLLVFTNEENIDAKGDRQEDKFILVYIVGPAYDFICCFRLSGSKKKEDKCLTFKCEHLFILLASPFEDNRKLLLILVSKYFIMNRLISKSFGMIIIVVNYIRL